MGWDVNVHVKNKTEKTVNDDDDGDDDDDDNVMMM